MVMMPVVMVMVVIMMMVALTLLVMVMMVVMMVAGMGGYLHVAGLLVAMLALLLQFQRHMADAVLCQFLTDGMLDMVVVSVCHHMHSGKVALAVHAPNVDMVDIQNTVQRF